MTLLVMGVAVWLGLLWALRTLLPLQGHDPALGGVALAGIVALGLAFLRSGTRVPGGPFTCPRCEAKIEAPLETSGEGGEPVLYFCFRCDVLWFTGSTVKE